MKTIVLHGDLANHIPGGRFQCEFNTPREAANAIEVNYPGFFKLIRDQYITIVPGDSKESLHTDEQLLSWNIRHDELHIIPDLDGSGGGSNGKSKGLKAILGIALVAVAIIGTGGLGGIAGGSLKGAVFGNTFGVTGMQLLRTGIPLIMQAFAPSPAGPDKDSRIQNTIFTGPTITDREGAVLPYVAGERVIVGGVVINSDLEVANG